MLPFYLYFGLMEGIVRMFFKLVFIGLKVGEAIPVVGPRITNGVEYISETRFFRWVMKIKED
jgi:hypothetical protein